MFDLIEQAEHYPQFLPWCTGAKILERSDDWVAARIDFSYLKVRFGFQTRNPKRRPEWLHVRLVEGPFRTFQGDWQLTPLGSNGCRINFDLSFEIADGWFDKIAVSAVERVSRTMMDAFVKRAEDTLSPRSPAPAPAAVAATVPQPEPAQPVPANPTETTMTSTDPALYEAVRACPLAADLTPEQTAVLAGLVRLESFQPKQMLASEGSTDNRLYVVVEGSLGVVKHRDTPDEVVLATLNPGDFAHELGFLDGAPRYASLVSLNGARVLTLEREKLETLIESQPLVLYRVMCAIVRTVHRIQTRLSVQATELTNYVTKQHGRY
jgi:ribosome-associated toxin RatA of RatAB toxin-antitoxin module/CRP-like cAMP-binding protein